MSYGRILLYDLLIYGFIFIFPSNGLAYTKWGGSVSLEESKAISESNNSNLLQANLNLDIKPPVKKRIDTRFNVQLRFTKSDDDQLWNLSPIGNLGLDFNGDSYRGNLKHSAYSTISSTAELTETDLSMAGLIITPENLPHISSNYSTITTTTGDQETKTDSLSFASDYSYKFMRFKGAYSKRDNFTGSKKTLSADNTLFGVGINYEIFEGTSLIADFDLEKANSDSVGDFHSENTSKGLTVSSNSLLTEWLTVNANFSKDINDFSSSSAATSSTGSQTADISTRLSPLSWLQLSSTLGNRKFDDIDSEHSINSVTWGITTRGQVQENIKVGTSFSRTTESDSSQGDNIRDGFSLLSSMDLTARIAARFNINVSRSENPTFINDRGFDASGTFAERANHDNERLGFTYFDSENNNLYTKKSPTPGDWSDAVHFDPRVEQFAISKTLQIDMIPTDKTNISISYKSDSTGNELDLYNSGNQSINGSIRYSPNLRTNYSITGTLAIPRVGTKSHAETFSMSYRFFREHQMSLSYGRQHSNARTSDNFSSSLRLQLRKAVAMNLTYSSTQLFEDEQTQFIRFRISKSF